MIRIGADTYLLVMLYVTLGGNHNTHKTQWAVKYVAPEGFGDAIQYATTATAQLISQGIIHEHLQYDTRGEPFNLSPV